MSIDKQKKDRIASKISEIMDESDLNPKECIALFIDMLAFSVARGFDRSKINEFDFFVESITRDIAKRARRMIEFVSRVRMKNENKTI